MLPKKLPYNSITCLSLINIIIMKITSAMVAKDLELFGITNNNVRASTDNTDKSVLAPT